VWTGQTRSEEILRRLDVDGHVAEGVVAVHEGVLNAVGDVVTVGDGDGSVDADVEVGDEGEPAFSDATFFDIFDARDGERGGGDFGDDGGRGLLVENVA